MKIKNLTAAYDGNIVLDKLSLEIADSGITCFSAPSGSGKTTLLNTIAGLKTDYTGTLEGFPTIIAAVFQEDRLIPQLTALDNVRLVLEKNSYSLAENYLSELGLKDYKNHLPAQLSGGMKRRVAIARAFAFGKAHPGSLYLMDEPLKGLDSDLKHQVINFIKKEIGKSPGILVTHDPTEAKILANQTILFTSSPMRPIK